MKEEDEKQVQMSHFGKATGTQQESTETCPVKVFALGWPRKEKRKINKPEPFTLI